MSFKRISFFICLALIISFANGCDSKDQSQPTDVPTTADTLPIETAPEEEKRMPVITDNSIELYYDDVLTLESLGCQSVDISEQVPTSKIAGTEDADQAVLYYLKDRKAVVAVGTGTAILKADDKVYSVTVTAAPISLFMITGHSIGAGQTGIADQSVLCEDGQAYSLHGTNLISEYIPGMGIGFGAQNKLEGIDAFTSFGKGTIGEGGALAWQWNQLTGEKVWVLNAAVGGTCLSEWVKGETAYENAVSLFRYAQKVLTAEITAGHYRLKDMAIVYHSSANFSYKNVKYDHVNGKFWYESMWNGFKNDLSMDMDGDGNKETVQAMGMVPIWTNQSFHDDKSAVYYMAANDVYKDMFMASLDGREWVTPDGFNKYFPTFEYKTHSGEVSIPTGPAFLFSDGVHYVQGAYNALGFDIAENMYHYFRKVEAPENFRLMNGNNKVYDTMDLRRGKSVELTPFVEPISVNDLTFVVSDNLELTYPCTITAKKSGTGTLTVYYRGQILDTVTFNIND